MKLFNKKIASYLSLGLILSACDPASIDPESLGSAGSSTSLFQLESDDFSEGTLTNGDITVSSGDKTGSGTLSSPIEFSLARVYSFTWASTISTDSTLKFSMYLPENPDVEVAIAEIDCDAASSTSCGATQEMECWFVGAGGTADYYTSFYCKHGDDFVESVSSQETMAYAIQPEWSGVWADLDLTVGVKAQLCDASSDTSCDIATLGYLNLKGYVAD